MNYARATFVLVFTGMVLLAMFYFHGRMKNNEFFDETRKEWSELRGQVESQNQLLNDLRSKFADHENNSRVVPSASSTTSPALESLNRRLSELAAQQSNIVASVQRQGRARAVESPEEAAQRAEAAIKVLQKSFDEQRQKLNAARENLDNLRVSLSVPDEVAALDDSKSTYDPRVSQYQTYFEARQAFEELRRLAQILQFKLAAERIDANLPVSR